MKFLFVLQILFGLLMLLGGLAKAVSPYAALDGVLTEAEMKDEEKRAFAERIVKGTAGSSLVWMGGGAAIAGMGLLGAATTNRCAPDSGREAGG